MYYCEAELVTNEAMGKVKECSNTVRMLRHKRNEPKKSKSATKLTVQL